MDKLDGLANSNQRLLLRPFVPTEDGTISRAHVSAAGAGKRPGRADQDGAASTPARVGAMARMGLRSRAPGEARAIPARAVERMAGPRPDWGFLFSP